ncbi:MAG: sodium:solute symporter family protein [Ruminococcaceae bacterium]|nr:sodium:solute symporter family protein [Oscillospiraceae bacterium]
MDKLTTIWIVIAVYAIFMLVVGILNSGKDNSSSMEKFTVGGRNAGAWISALSYGTAYFSAVMFIGYSGGSGWSYGLWSALVGVGNAVFGSFLAWKVLANRTRDYTRRLKIKSMPQLFETRFRSPGMRIFSCLVIFVFLVPYSASVYKGLTSICSVILGIDENVCMIIIALASAVVLVLGGYIATLKADFVQGFIMMIGVTALIVLVIVSPQVGGLTNGINNMAEYMKENKMMPLDASSTVSLISMILMTSFGTWGLPQMVHKYYGIKDAGEVKRGTIISTLFALLVAGGGYFIGSFSHLFFGNEMPEGGKDYLVPLMLDKAGLPDILIGVVLVLLISASVSTLSGITLSACSTFSMDFIKGTVKKDISDKSTATLTRIMCLVFVVFSYIIATTDTPIIELMSYSWGIISGAFIGPYVLTLYMKKINRFGAWCGMLSGFLVAFIPAAASGFTTPDGPLYACIAMASSFVVTILASMISSKLKLKGSEENDSFYNEQTEN